MIVILADRVDQGGVFVETLGVDVFYGCTRGRLKDGQDFRIITHPNQLDGLLLDDFYVAWPEYYWNANQLVQKALSRIKQQPKMKLQMIEVEAEPVSTIATTGGSGPEGPDIGCALILGILAFAAWDIYMLWQLWVK